MLRTLLIIIAIPVLLVVLAAVLVPLLLDRDAILELATAEIYKQTGATLKVDGEVDLTVFPTLGLALADVSLDMPGEQQSSLAAKDLQIGVQLLPLLSKQVQIDNISMEGVVIKIETLPAPPPMDTSKLTNKQLDELYALRRKTLADAGTTAGAEAAIAVPLALNVAKFSIKDSRLEMTEVGGDTTVIEVLNMLALDLNLDGEPISLELSLGLPLEQALEIDVDGSVSIDQATQILTIKSIDTEIRGATLEPLQVSISGDVDINDQIAGIDLKATTGKIRAKGQLRYASFESPQIDTQLSLNLLDPALLILAGPEAAAQAAKTPSSSKTPAKAASGNEPLPLDAIRLIDTRADLAIEQARFDAHTIENVKVLLRAKDGVIQISKLTGALHGGELNATAVFNGKHNTARLNTKGHLKALDIATALQAMGSPPLVTGTTDLNWTLTSSGSTANELTEQLSGPITIAASDAVLQDVAVEKLFCEGVALVNQQALTATFPTNSDFKSLYIDVQMADGKANLAPLRAELAGISLTGTGSLALATQTFKASFKARLSSELGQEDPACRVNERITSIDWPVACKGSLSGEPGDWCGIATGDILKDLATQEAGRKVKKKLEEKFGDDAGKLLDGWFKK